MIQSSSRADRVSHNHLPPIPTHRRSVLVTVVVASCCLLATAGCQGDAKGGGSSRTSTSGASASRPADSVAPAKTGAGKDQSARFGPGFDPKRFDTIAFAPRAAKLASEQLKAPELIKLSAIGIDAQGLVDTTKLTTALVYYFKASDKCALVAINAGTIKPEVSVVDNDFCDAPPLGKLRCSLKQIMDRATAKGPPPKGNRGVFSVVVAGGKRRWDVSFGSWKQTGNDC